MVDFGEDIVSAEKCGRQGKKNKQFGKIAYNAQIEQAVAVVCLRTETETASFVGMIHKGTEKQPWNEDRSAPVQRYLAGYGFGGKQLFESDAKIGQLAEP